MHEHGLELGSAHHVIFIFAHKSLSSKKSPSAKKKVAAVKRKAKDKTQDSANRWLSTIPETLEEGIEPDMAQHDEEELDADNSPDIHPEKHGADS